MKKINYLLIAVTLFVLLLAFWSCDKSCEHEYDTSAVAAACDKPITASKACRKCGENVEYTVQPKGHAFKEEVVAATCTSDGYTIYTCECGFSYKSDVISVLGHDFRSSVNAPDCENPGDTLNFCKRCDFVYTSDTVKPIGHKLVATVTAPTCTEVGHTTYKCSECSFEYVSELTLPLGHKILTYTVSPTCTEEGYTQYSCENCDLEYISDRQVKLDHSFSSEIIKNVSCTEAGEVRYTCSCSATYSEIVAPSGHDFSRLVTMPTLSDMGYTEYSCQNCDFEYVGDYRFYSSILNSAYADTSEHFALGIDISCYNHVTNDQGEYLPIDWNAVSDSGIDYVILKAGSTLRENGTKGGEEVTFEDDYLGAHEAGLDVGVYFYTYAKSVAEIRIDAYMLLSILDGKKFEYPIYLDLEDDSLLGIDKGTLNEMCVEFFTILQRAGYYTGLYVNHEWLYNIIDSSTALSKFEIWYARYPSDGNNAWDNEIYGEPLGMWQYTDLGVIDAFGEDEVDMNVSFKDYPSIIIEGGYNGYDSDVNFTDDGLEFVWILANSLSIRSSNSFVGSENVIGYASFGSRFIVLEKNENYTKILYNGKEAYISANPKYISFTPVW